MNENKAIPVDPGQTAPLPFLSMRNPHLSVGKWVILLLVEAIAFAVLLLVPVRAVGALVFTGAPLLALWLLGRDMLKDAIRVPHWRQVLLGILLGLLALAVTFVLSFVETLLSSAPAPNPITGVLASNALAQNLFLLLVALVQLVGEELLTLILFMATFQLADHFLPGKKSAVAIAWVASSLLFGVAHIATYSFNWIHVLLVIGASRMILTSGWLKTKNLVTAYISHILVDNTVFIFTIIQAAL